MTASESITDKSRNSFNPCFNGFVVMTTPTQSHTDSRATVSILVLMDSLL